MQKNHSDERVLADYCNRMGAEISLVRGWGELLELEAQENLTERQKEILGEILNAGERLQRLKEELGALACDQNDGSPS